MKNKEEECVLFATSIAMQLAKGLSLVELEELRNLVNQVSSSLGTLIVSRYATQKCLTSVVE